MSSKRRDSAVNAGQEEWAYNRGFLWQVLRHNTYALGAVNPFVCFTLVGGILGVPFNDYYCSSKFAVEGLYESMSSMNSQLGEFWACS